MNKPNCFAIPSIFSFKSNVCGGCSHFNDCQKETHSALLAVNDLRLVASELSQHESFRRQTTISFKKIKANRLALTAEQLDALEAYPKKVGAYLKSVWSKGKQSEMLSRIARDLNPFELEGAASFNLAYHLMSERKTSRGDIIAAFVTHLGWSKAAAHSQATMIWHIFPALKVATVDGAYMTSNGRVRQ